MARNIVEFSANPDDVFDVLVDAYAYGHWVVGPRQVVDKDPDFPNPQSEFTHETRIGPLHLQDTTKVVEVERPRRLVLRAKIRAMGLDARISFELAATADGTRVTLDEEPLAGPWRVLWNPAFDAMMWARNSVALERLRFLAEQRSSRTETQTPESVTEQPGPPAFVGAATALAFRGIAALRGRRRVFHPSGRLYEGTLTLGANPSLPASAFFMEPGSYPAIVRTSRGAGLPSALPDVLGLAIKLPDRWGPGADQDFLLVSSGEGPIGRRMLVPVSSNGASRYSSLTSYDIAGNRVMFGATPGSGVDFVLSVAIDGGDWLDIGSLTLDAPCTTEDVSFSPWNTGPDMVPTGVINALRKQAYVGSRAGRNEPS